MIFELSVFANKLFIFYFINYFVIVEQIIILFFIFLKKCESDDIGWLNT